ncbi:MAG: hypothetical protein JO352_23025 [Chloroflexi bacterium]|nr:hypothetical protein [Chloroflexota bacterium]MBV9597678.1 hypothetical protein [Chloroflexota bacterium]
MFVFAGPTDQGFDGGTVTGTVVLRHGLESDTRAYGQVSVRGNDPKTHDVAFVDGAQVTNNVSDSLVDGGFHVTLFGPQFDEIIAGPDFSPSGQPTPTGKNGSMSCFTGNPTVSTPGAPPPYFENEVNDAPDPNS